MITVFDILKYYYCPREFYLLKVLKVPYQAKSKMVMGRKEQAKEEKRKLINNIFGEKLTEIKFNVELTDHAIGLKGKLDGVAFLDNGDIVPVEMKYSDFMDLNIQKKKQIYAYARLIEYAYGVHVKEGYILFIKQRNFKLLKVTRDDVDFIAKDVEKLRRILESERIPPPTSIRKCGYCEVRKFCGRPLL